MKPTNTFTGRQAEIAAAHELRLLGFSIVDKNWRQLDCEIDIIAKKKEVIFFYEVKYRQNYEQGGGLEYITKAKRQRMAYAADKYMKLHDLDYQYCLGAIEVVGRNFIVDKIIESID